MDPAANLKKTIMDRSEAIVAQFADHAAAEAAIRTLNEQGFDISHLSIVGRGYHVDEQVLGFYNSGDRIRFWGSRGAIWGGLWGLFFGGVFITVPITGPILVLGYMATTLIAALEGAVALGGASAIAAALYGIGIPHDSVLAYETALAADRFLVIVHDRPSRITLARELLGLAGATHIDAHTVKSPAERPAIPLPTPA
jgi:hypothetical protein